MKTFADRVKARRMDLKARQHNGQSWSQGYVAAKCGITQQAYAEVEKGATKNPGFIIELAAALLTTPEWLKSGAGDIEGPINAITEPPVKSRQSPNQAAMDMEQAIIALCEALPADAREKVCLSSLVARIYDVLGRPTYTPEPTKGVPAQKKSA